MAGNTLIFSRDDVIVDSTTSPNHVRVIGSDAFSGIILLLSIIIISNE
jgi:hypothetical protein